jgi:enoyl-CoA hydratase/carnithine racemase
MSELRYEIDDGVALITFDRPAVLNVFTPSMIEELGALYRRSDEDPAVRVVVLTGSGRAFCAGADLSRPDTFVAAEGQEVSSCPLSMQAWEVRKPVIAACNGHAVGIGLGIAVQCDMRVLALEGLYGFLQNRRGVVADFAVEYLLPRLVGFERAFELLVRGERLDGATARDWGLAARAVPAAEVLPTALGIARDMVVNCSPLVMGMHKRLLWRGLDLTRDAHVALETRALGHSMRQPDALEGGLAYAGKRAPAWSALEAAAWPDFI